ncbi:MAG: gamma-glutamyl-gamma-aminobutyrate hydrolase family protein [Longimicrobiales bacterium]
MSTAANRRPLVAITTSQQRDEGGYRPPQITLYSNYIAALDRLGLSALLLTTAHGAAATAELMELASGLLLTGGDDIDPELYGESPIPALGAVDRDRDEAELRALDLALERELPVLGICRGHQVINVHFGGTLYQDIATQLGTMPQTHMGDWAQHHHEVDVVEPSLLASLISARRFHVNSYHHQAVKALGKGLRCTAEAEGGLIEAIETDDGHWILGVQWHPERHEAQASESDPNLQVFAGFRDAVMARAQR